MDPFCKNYDEYSPSNVFNDVTICRAKINTKADDINCTCNDFMLCNDYHLYELRNINHKNDFNRGYYLKIDYELN